MNLLDLMFYGTAAIILVSTGLAVTRLNTVHAVCYLVISFVATAVLFALLGAPLLAALQVIVYAGGIMVLFLFVIMMIRGHRPHRGVASLVRQWLPALVLGGACATLAGLLVFADPSKSSTKTSVFPPLATIRFQQTPQLEALITRILNCLQSCLSPKKTQAI